jgi:outer membrane protein assembly factor BamB
MMKKMAKLVILSITCCLCACAEGGQSPSAQAPALTPLWTVPVNGAFKTFSNNGKLIGLVDWADTLTLAAFEPKQRKITWKSQPHAPLGLDNNFVVGEGVVYYMVPEKNLEVYDLETGQILESLSPPTGITFKSGGLGAYQKIVAKKLILNSDNSLVVYDVAIPSKPKQLWVRNTEENGYPRATDADASTVYLAASSKGNQYIAALNAQTGETIWNHPNPYLENHGALSLRVSGNGMYVMARDNSIRAFNTKTGQPLWARTEADVLRNECKGVATDVNEFIITTDTLYTSPNSGQCVWAINLKDGQIKWAMNAAKYGEPYSFGGTPLLVNGVVYAMNGRLWAVDAQNGEVLGLSKEVDKGWVVTNPQFINGEIIAWGLNATGFKPVR